MKSMSLYILHLFTLFVKEIVYIFGVPTKFDRAMSHRAPSA